MSMLLSSERVYSDMLDWLWFGEPEQVVLREWEPELSVDFEFRCYVKDGRLNAISQYDHYCKYDHLFPRKTELERRMRTLWAEIHPHVGASSYGMDFGYLPAQDKLVMIELSPFLRCTGAHCFRQISSAWILTSRRPLLLPSPLGGATSTTTPCCTDAARSSFDWCRRLFPSTSPFSSAGGRTDGPRTRRLSGPCTRREAPGKRLSAATAPVAAPARPCLRAASAPPRGCSAASWRSYCCCHLCCAFRCCLGATCRSPAWLGLASCLP